MPQPDTGSAENPGPPPSARGRGGQDPSDEDLLGFFTRALEDYQRSDARFRVLCSLVPPAPATTSESKNPAPAPPVSRPRRLLVLDSSFNPPTRAHLRMAASAASDRRYSSERGGGDGGGSGTRVLLLLATNNADKAPRPAAFPHRLAMMYVFARDLAELLAAGPSPGPGTGMAIDIGVTTEPYFHSKSEAVASSGFYRPHQDTAAPDTDMQQVYLTGFDTLIRIFNPKYYPGPGPDPATPAMAASLDPFFARASLRVTARVDAEGAEWGDAGAQRAYLEGLRRGALAAVGGRTEWAARVELDGDADPGTEGQGEGEGEAPLAISSTKVRGAVVRGDWEVLRSLVSVRVAGWIQREGLYLED